MAKLEDKRAKMEKEGSKALQKRRGVKWNGQPWYWSPHKAFNQLQHAAGNNT